MSTLIYYGIENEERQNKLLETADKLQIEKREVDPKELGEYLGYLAGLPGYDKRSKEEEIVKEELLVFVDFSSELLQKFLLDLREKGEIFPHKAAMTETTKDWTFGRLVRHIQNENAVVTAWAQMIPIVKNSLEKQKTSPTKEREEAIEWSKKLREKGEDLTEEDVREAIRRLKDAE